MQGKTKKADLGRENLEGGERRKEKRKEKLKKIERQ
jgi:hypothetical protein